MIHLQRSLIDTLKTDQPSVDSIISSLQQAVELEHATIPTYLYGLYSLDEKKNKSIASIIQSVVVEEMLHMTLASNVLNALGGDPMSDKPDFIPNFPGPLPGGVDEGLIVHLAPFSMEQLETYISIEQPEDPLHFPTRNALAETDRITIGEFYTAVAQAIAKLPSSAFHNNPPRNQVGPDLIRDSVVVFDNSTAQKAIQTIVDQGEGTTTSPEEIVGDEVAHYYRFMEIKKGKQLVREPGTDPARWAYAGDPIVLDPSGVYPVPSDPKASKYPVGSAARKACDTFNYTYTSLLKSLHALFNGDATEQQMNAAIGLMMSVKEQAKAMMSGIPNPDLIEYPGPSFEYQATNP